MLIASGALFGILVATHVVHIGPPSGPASPASEADHHAKKVPADVRLFTGFNVGTVDDVDQEDVVDLDWKTVTTWKNPFRTDEVESLPMGVNRHNMGSIKQESVSSYFTKSMAEYQGTQASNWGINVVLSGMFSAGAKANTIRTKTFSQSESQYYIESRLTYELYQDKLASSAVWSESLQAAIKTLPPLAAKNDTIYTYFDFFNTFGTHYVNQVTWGGMKWASFMLAQSTVESKKVSEGNLGVFASYKLQGLVHSVLPPKQNESDGDASWSRKKKDEWKSFDQNTLTVFDTTTTGGDATLMDHTEWLRSIPDLPMAISRNLKPYSQVAQKFAPDRAADLATAMEKYVH